MKRRTSVAIALAAVLSFAAAGVTVGGAPRELTFEKSLAGAGVWEGTVGGDETGTIETYLAAVNEAGSVWYVTFDWTVEIDGGDRIIAEVEGIINLRTGRVVMNGEVLDGYLVGSRIHVEAQLDLTDMSSEGTMLITP